MDLRFIQQYIKRDRKYQEYTLKNVGNYPYRYLEFTNILRKVGNID